MKQVMCLVLISLVAATASAVVHPGYTYQCWQFDTEAVEPYELTVWNPFGDPAGEIIDLSGQGVEWNQEGYWEGTNFKIDLNIPNRPFDGGWKELRITMVFQGEIEDASVVAVTGAPFDLVNESVAQQGNWNVYTADWWIEPNPRSELITIVLAGVGDQNAVISSICVDSTCIPEPATLALLGLGAMVLVRTRKGTSRS